MADHVEITEAGDPAEQSSRDEIKRQSRLIDQTISMQAALRDWNRTIGTSLACIVLIASLIGVAFAFAGGGEQMISLLGIRAQRVTWLGWLAVLTFALTLIDLVIDPRGAARRRAEAARTLGNLKTEYRAAVPSGQARESAERLSQRYEAVMGSIPEVPNPLFNRLKAAHLRKVEISKILSDRPGIKARKARRLLDKRVR
jgi:hypothetical protein